MRTYILKRLLLSIPMLIGITFISFMVMQLAPGASAGGGGGEMAAGRVTRDQWKVMNRTFHLDKPVWQRYFYWLGILQPDLTAEQRKEWEQEGTVPDKRGVIFGDFGNSMEIKSVRVIDRLKEAIPVTLLLNALSFLVIYALAIPIGIYSATHQNSLADRTLTVGMFMLYSLPSFWVAVVLIKIMVMLPENWQLPFQNLHPDGSDEMTSIQWLWGTAKHLVLPVAVMSYAGLAGLSRYMRSSMIDVIRADFVRVARAKGLREFIVVYKHALRNSLIPIITLLGGELPGLIGGSVIIESIFGIPGMGFLAFNALKARDYTILMADLTLVAVLVMIGFLISDLLYVVADPRIKFDEGD
jgi:peptide/nickel transport system permease protein